jgi:hypothetical protein
MVKRKQRMIDKFYYLIAILAAMIIGSFVIKNANHKTRPNTLPNYTVTEVHRYYADSITHDLMKFDEETKTYRVVRDEY